MGDFNIDISTISCSEADKLEELKQETCFIKNNKSFN